MTLIKALISFPSHLRQLCHGRILSLNKGIFIPQSNQEHQLITDCEFLLPIYKYIYIGIVEENIKRYGNENK